MVGERELAVGFCAYSWQTLKQWTLRYNKTLKPMVDSGCGNFGHIKLRQSRYTLAQLSVLLLAGSLMYLELYNMEGSVYRAFCNQNI